jgi:hypothetical protein
MMKVSLPIAALAVGAAGLGVLYWWMTRPQSTTAAFVCPEAQPQTTGMALKETPADVARASAALSGSEQENAISVIAADLRRRHPWADKTEIVNYLLTAYCPLVKKQNTLSDREKRKKMDQFSTQVYKIVN